MRLFLIAVMVANMGCSTGSWREASRESSGIARKAKDQTKAIFQIYHARAFSWRGYFGVHPWVAWKRPNDKEYTVAQVTSWGVRRNSDAVSIKQDLPDRLWFDSFPHLLFEIEGQRAEKVIDHVEELIAKYPYRDLYRLWPGPNSNTFVAYIIRNTPELDIELPASAIGKDYMGSSFFAKSPSATGFQFSVYGLLGLTMSLGEGVELNLLGLSIGVDVWTPALKLPFFGRVGFEDKGLSFNSDDESKK